MWQDTSQIFNHFEDILAQKLNARKLSQKLIFGPILAIFLKMTNSKHNSVSLGWVINNTLCCTCSTPCLWLYIMRWVTDKKFWSSTQTQRQPFSSKSTSCRPKWSWLSNNCNFASGNAIHLVLLSNPRFLSMGNHLGLFSWASDWSEGQEQGGGAVGGQGQFQGGKL